MSGSYLQVSGTIRAGLDGEIAELCGLSGCQGSVFHPLPDGRERVVFYLGAGMPDRAEEIRMALAALGAVEISIEEKEVEDWLEVYRRELEPFEVGRRFWIDPDPDSGKSAPSGRLRLVMEPRMAFGSGSHETTQLMLKAMEKETLLGRSVLDIGSGSGILSLAALRLGAARAVGLDIDLQSVLVARQLLRDQEIELRPIYLAGSLDALAPSLFDLVLCNMLSRYFLPQLEEIASLAGECLLLSGLLREEEETVIRRSRALGLRPGDVLRLGEWSCLRLERT